MIAASLLRDDSAVRLLGLQIGVKRTEQAALRSLGDALMGPSVLVQPIYRTWSAAKDAEWRVHRELKRNCHRTVIPFIPKTASR